MWTASFHFAKRFIMVRKGVRSLIAEAVLLVAIAGSALPAIGPNAAFARSTNARQQGKLQRSNDVRQSVRALAVVDSQPAKLPFSAVPRQPVLHGGRHPFHAEHAAICDAHLRHQRVPILARINIRIFRPLRMGGADPDVVAASI